MWPTVKTGHVANSDLSQCLVDGKKLSKLARGHLLLYNSQHQFAVLCLRYCLAATSQMQEGLSKDAAQGCVVELSVDWLTLQTLVFKVPLQVP